MTDDPRLAIAIRAACNDPQGAAPDGGCQYPGCACERPVALFRAALTALDTHAAGEIAAMRTPAADRQVAGKVERDAVEAQAAIQQIAADMLVPSELARMLAEKLARAGWRRSGRSE